MPTGDRWCPTCKQWNCIELHHRLEEPFTPEEHKPTVLARAFVGGSVVQFSAVAPLIRDVRRLLPDVYEAWRSVEPDALTQEQLAEVEVE